MRGRYAIAVALALGVSAVVASASGGGGAGALSASRTLRMPDADRCLRSAHVRITVLPPAATSFASLTVRARGIEVLQLADLAGPASVLVRLASVGEETRVQVSGTTSDGRFVQAGRRYERCRPAPVATPTPKPKPKPRPRHERPEGISGGGED